MKKIQLTKNQYTVIDEEDFEKVSQYNWYFQSFGYAARKVGGFKKQKTVLLHRFIMDAKQGEEIDHINGDKLDNRKENLRFCTHRQNAVNQRIYSTNTSGFRGVYAVGKKWAAQIYRYNKAIYLGSFETKELAAKARDEAARKEFGDFARLNFI